MQVLVLKGGPDAEREVSLCSGANVAAALRRAGLAVNEVTIDRPDLAEIQSMAGTVVFPVLHGAWGEGGPLQELLELDGRPKWRLSGSVNWESGPVEVGLFGQYTGEVWDTSVVRDILLVSDDPNANFFRVSDQFRMNLSIAYTIRNNTALDGTRLRFAVNNLFNEAPPLADETYGFLSELYTAYGRVFHIELRKRF